MTLLFPIDGENPKDVVRTPVYLVEDMISHFRPRGVVLDPCRGDGVFFDRLSEGREWCEITQGRDFLEWNTPVDWVFGNPPYSQYAKWIYHAMKIAVDIVYLMPCDKPFISYKTLRVMRKWGHVRHMRIYGPGNKFGFPIGFAIGAVHFQRLWFGPMDFSFWDGSEKRQTP